MLDLEVERGELEVVEGLTSSKDANIMLGVTGDLKGTVLLALLKIYFRDG